MENIVSKENIDILYGRRSNRSVNIYCRKNQMMD